MKTLPKPLRLSVFCLHACAAAYALFGGALLFVIWSRVLAETSAGTNPWVASGFGVFLLFFAVLIEALIAGLKRRIAPFRFLTQIFCVLSIFSPLLPLAIPALWGIRSAVSRNWFEETPS